MEVGQTVFKEIIKNLKPLDSVIGDECLQSVVKSFTLTIYSNENTEFSIDECGTFINKKHVGYDLTNEQIEVLKELLKAKAKCTIT